MSFCFILALSAVLGPMMVLFGLKFGFVGNMLDDLIENPRNREISPVSSGQYTRTWIDIVRKRGDVAFVVPRTRSIAATMDITSQLASKIISAEVIATDKNDPLLSTDLMPPIGLKSIIVSKNLADKLDLDTGDIVDGSIQRQFKGKRERVHLQLTVSAIAPRSAFSRDGFFASQLLIESLEDYRDGRAVPAAGWTGNRTDEERTYPGFRLYTNSIYEVEGLASQFTKQGINVRTHSADISMVQQMDQNLSIIFWAIALVGLVGFSLSLGANLWANVDRKRRELSVLRLVGFRTGDITWFPVVQAAYTAVLGWALAWGIFEITSWAINDMLSAQIEITEDICVLLPEHLAIALALTVVSAIVAASLAGFKSARIEASEGMRET